MSTTFFTPRTRKILASVQASLLLASLLLTAFPVSQAVAQEAPTTTEDLSTLAVPAEDLTAAPAEVKACEIVSNETVQEGGTNSYVVEKHPAWTTIPGASYVWGDPTYSATTVDEDQVFTKTFSLTDIPTSADLSLAADNGFLLTVNGTTVEDRLAVADNFSSAYTQDIASNLQSGTNTIEVRVRNLGTTDSDNPGGLAFRVDIEGANCGTSTTPADPEYAQVHIYKYLSTWEGESQLPDDADAPGFPMHAAWSADNIGTGNANYELGGATPNLGGAPYEYSAMTSPMETPADYTTYERTRDVFSQSPVLPAAAACEPDTYRLVGYRYASTLEDAELAELSTSAPEFFNLTEDRHVIVVNEDCDDVLNPPTGSVNICKVDSQEAPLSGWQLMLLGDYVDEVSVQPDGEDHTIEDADSGNYVAIADGAYTYRPSEPNASLSDAAYSQRHPSDSVYGGPYAPWVRVNSFPEPYTGWLGVMINDAVTDWGSVFNPEHIYAHSLGLAEQTDLSFKILDDTYSDNSGTVNVSLFEGFTATTGENGCVTFDNVPYGSYSISEIAQEGWEIVPEGSDTEVVVDEETESFVLMNQNVDGPEPFLSEVRMCKADSYGNPLSGWTLMLKGSFLESLNVPTNNSAGVSTSNQLMEGFSYIAQVAGTWTNQGGANAVDAEYSTTDGWTTVMDGYDGYQTDILELQINETFDPNSNWGPYNSLHTYAQSFVQGSADEANFRVFDGTGTTPNEGWYADNAGTLMVDLFEGYSGVTGEDGCVTFSDVPYGVYTADEIDQEGWELVAEESDVEVVIDEPAEYVSLVNHDTNLPPPPQQCVLVSDETTLEGGSSSSLVSFIHSAWTAIIDGASWIWGEDPVADPENETTETFTKTFWLDSVPTSASLEIASDNSYTASVNGTTIGADPSGDNFSAEGQDTIVVPTTLLTEGANTLVITVTNFATPGGTTETNPAGLKYRLTLSDTRCDEMPPPQESVQVFIYKYLRDGAEETLVPDASDAPSFPMTSSWESENLGTGSGSYVLGNGHGGAPYRYSAVTSEMTSPADYATSEVTDGSVVVAPTSACEAGKYRLLGYRVGDTRIEAENAPLSTTAPSFTALAADKHIIVVNEDCDDGEDPTDPVNTNETIVVTNQNLNGWEILNYDVTDDSDDSTTTQQGTEGRFVTGPATPPQGTGSLEQDLGPNGDEATRIRTGAFGGTLLADINELSYSTYVQNFGSAGQATYLQIYVDHDNDGDFEDVLFFEPVYQTGTYGGDTVPNQGELVTGVWQTWNARIGGFWAVEDGTYGPPLVTLDSYIAEHPGARVATGPNGIRLTAGFGAGAWDNFLGNADKLVIGTDTTTGTHTRTYDFELASDTTTVTTTNGGGGGGGSRRSGNNNDSEGEVLGESTGPGEVLGAACPLLSLYLREGAQNDANEVAKLESFLNGEMGTSLTVDGIFDSLTTAAVNAFQVRYWEDVLAPWVPFGLPSAQTPTGYVYKTTLWKINSIACPGLTQPPPQLP